ncbi:MAG TPA: hypothetical protein VGB13_09195 [Candidatus Krumholzibacteria bacterium]|jgi:hypothetical protein
MGGHGLLRILLCAAWLAAGTGVTHADDYGPPLGSLRLSFDANAPTQELDVEPFTTFSWYVMAEVDFGDPTANSRDGLLLWEARVAHSPEINILDRQVQGDPLTCANGSCGDEWQVYLSRCFFANEAPFLLVRYDAQLLTDVSDLEIKLMPTTLSNFGGTAPGWAVCSSHGVPSVDLHPFASGWTTALIINSSVRAEAASWSALKARF